MSRAARLVKKSGFEDATIERLLESGRWGSTMMRMLRDSGSYYARQKYGIPEPQWREEADKVCEALMARLSKATLFESFVEAAGLMEEWDLFMAIVEQKSKENLHDEHPGRD